MSGPLPEPEVVTPTSRPTWIAVLSGPSLWFGHFMAVYLIAEVVCDSGTTGPQILGLSALKAGVVVLTILAVVTLGVAAVRTQSYRRQLGSDADPMLVIALWLDALFAVAIIFVGLPPLVLVPCQ
ncbi:MAG: hypothetical protein ACR2HR_14655 [Euzebya sp.]